MLIDLDSNSGMGKGSKPFPLYHQQQNIKIKKCDQISNLTLADNGVQHNSGN